MPIKTILLILGIFILSSCSKQKTEQAERADSIDIASINSVRQQKLIHFNDSLYTLFEKSPRELVSEFGNPKRSQTRLFTNVHNGEIDTIYSLDFDSISATLYYAASQKRYLVGSVDVRDNSLINILGFNIGDRDTAVVNSLGLADRSEMDSTGIDIFTYKLGDIAESYTQFYFKNSKLIKVVYLPYLD